MRFVNRMSSQYSSVICNCLLLQSVFFHELRLGGGRVQRIAIGIEFSVLKFWEVETRNGTRKSKFEIGLPSTCPPRLSF